MAHDTTSQRRAGVLLHPTSLPSGKLDTDVDRWLDFLSHSGFSVWQMLPLGEPQVGLSPYQCSSAFALNPALFEPPVAVDDDDTEFAGFCDSNAHWLDDYALFKVLKTSFGDVAWTDWPDEIRHHEPIPLSEISERYATEIIEIKWHQFSYHKHWSRVKSAANERDILLFGDMPIFVGYDSADVWANQDQFMLDENGDMLCVTGVPPDYFSDTGQRWGNPHYRWDRMKQDGYQWWRYRVDHYLALFDMVRIDHFRGLQAVWVIDADCDTAIDGFWQEAPGDELLNSFKQSIHACNEHLPFIAEDLGVITPEVDALRLKHELPGMSVLQFSFDNFDDNPHKLKNITADRVVYTGTHDNDTSAGWFHSLNDYDKTNVLETLGLADPVNDDVHADHPASVSVDADTVVDKMIDDAMHSEANLCVIPMQDILHLDSDSRMNIPGTVDGNWTWRFDWSQLDEQTQQRMSELITATDRKPVVDDR